MKKLLITAGTLIVLNVGSAARAADMGVPTKAPPPAPIFTWTGCFFGGNGGGLWVAKEWFDRTPADVQFGNSYGKHSGTGGLGGVQGGCDYQFNGGGLVIGIQADYDWTSLRANNDNLLLAGFR